MGMEANQFDLLVDVDKDDPSLVIAATEKKAAASRHGVQSKLLTKPLPPAQAVRESMNYGAPAPGRGRGGSSGDRTSPRREFGDGDTNVVQGRYSGGGLGDDGVVRREDGEAKASERGHGLRQPYCDGYTGGDYMR